MISLPPEVTFEKRQLPNGGWSYDFRHSTMGALGRILMQGLPGDRATHISCEVAGNPADPRTAERRRIFEPIGLEISRQMEQATGAYSNSGPTMPPTPPREPTEAVKTKLMQCPICNGFAAMLIFAPDATDTGRFEDYARLMYRDYASRNLPAWIIGPDLGLKTVELAEILKVWPERESIQRLSPEQFNKNLRGITARHCK